MNIITNVLNSSLGKKYIMAVSGCALFLFVVGHLVGNLQIFLGREAINRYGHFLQSNPELIWPARLTMLLMVVLHIWSATWRATSRSSWAGRRSTVTATSCSPTPRSSGRRA